MKIIITGSLGNISKPLTKELVHKGHLVTVISSKSEKQSAIELLGATAAIGSIEDVTFLTNTFTGADAVYCMLPPFDYFDPNLDIMATTRRQIGNYCAAILASGVKNVVHLSSIGAHTDKGNGLLAFHHLAERLFKELPSDVIIKHARPVGFYTNMYDFKTSIEAKGFLGIFLTVRFNGLWSLITGKKGVIAANYGADDKMPWVSPVDIAASIAQLLTTPFVERMFQYIASEELTCNEIAKIIGTAIGKPWLKWALMSDKDMLGGLKMFKMPESRAQGVVDMNAGMHNGLVNEDYYKNKPKVMGKIKMKDFAKEFAAVYNQ
ncbi:NAD(P)H-binding protein [Mucilaginibacter sp.]|uniref:NmrA family NAD(P)-binding protein n=1 Tax=Mucilaginibacter sp. TaxID=1882438 RepID=UPI003D0CEE2D